MQAMTMPQERFADRIDAGRHLAKALARYRGTHPLVLAIPRGGVPIGGVVADALDGDLDVVLVRKLGAPGNPEFAIGAVDESGTVRLADYAHRVRAGAAYIDREKERELAVIHARRESYSPHRQPLDPAGRIAIVVDDGLATGETMRSALSAVRAQHPSRLICAVPVAAPESLEAISSYADEIVCVRSPQDFYAVGQFYDRFPAVEDEEVIALLSRPPTAEPTVSKGVRVRGAGVSLEGRLDIPPHARGLVVFSHGSGSGRNSPRNRFVASQLNLRGLATLLIDLLTEREDADRAARFDIALLADRLGAAVEWAARDPELRQLPIGLFGASTGAAAALIVAARRPDAIAAVVSRGGRPDLAGRALAGVSAPTLLIVGGADPDVLDLNKAALAEMPGSADLVVVPGATHLFEEPGTLEQVATLAADWFERGLAEESGRATAARSR
jgi:predicted phosphoribosyltransferase/dienelactone hydrolase